MSSGKGDNPRVSDQEITALIEKYADEHDVPVEVLEKIYAEERAVVGMERRSSIFKDVDSILKHHVDEQLDSSSNDE
jgi:hypothetical protein